MARITVEDCIEKVQNRFDLIVLSAHRAREISAGDELTVPRDNDKNPVVSLREIAEESISSDNLREGLISSMQTQIIDDEVSEHEEEDNNEETIEDTLALDGLDSYYSPPTESAAQGGIIGLKEGGMLNFGGREMDLRGGGFVPIGKKEKADDVPARLSKNEFVMTADAVRAAGGGSVNKGAQRMYNLMNNLEARA